MKIYLSSASILLGSVYLLSSCSVRLPSKSTPKPSYYTTVDQIKVMDGYPINKEPWVVVSDRSNNTVFMDKGDERSPKEIKFLEPLLVVKHNKNKGLIKVAAYDPNALLQKIPAKSVKSYGWIPEDQLLLWTNALRKEETGFTMKAALVPNNSDVFKNGAKYLKNDSVLIYQSPQLTVPIAKKLAVGQLVYIYKQAEGNKRYLIGNAPSAKVDSISATMYGWVSSNMIAAWGDRSGLRVSPEYSFEEDKLSIKKLMPDGTASPSGFYISEAQNRTPIQNIVAVTPTVISAANKGRFFDNAFNYENNFVYNVLGQPLSYERYKEIIHKNKNLNIVFTLDVSDEDASQNSALVKSAFQDLKLKLNKMDYYRNVKYGVVLYKNNSCGENVAVSELNADYNKTTKYIELQSAAMRCRGYGAQPMQEGLAAAGELLSTKSDDTNLVILIGTTATPNGSIYEAVRSLSVARAKIISFQSVAGASDYYSNFVLLSENVVTTTARNIAELQKAREINQNLILNKNNYKLVEGEDGSYSLDYPKTSMTQGFVIYPKKGEVNANGLLAKSVDSLLSQVTQQNRAIDLSLTNYFKSVVGVTKTHVKYDYISQYSDAANPIPVEVAGQLVTYDNPFLTKGIFSDDYKNADPVISKGILVSEAEFDELRRLYLDIYKETMPVSINFNQNRAMNSYFKVLKKHHKSALEFDKNKIKSNSMAYSVAVSTGFDNFVDESLSKYMLQGWKKSKIMPNDAVKAYFSQYRILADRLLENKSNPKVRIDQNGTIFYWLNSYFMPGTALRETL